MSAQAALSGDPAHDVLRYGRRPLDAIFAPNNVAVIGATEEIGSVGRTLVRNLISNPSTGAVFPVNPGRNSVLGLKAYPHVRDIPEPVDLAIVATPAPTVPGVIRECAEVGIPGAVVVSAGFKETGAEGAELEKRVLAEARRGRMRVLGPNCLGVMRPASGFNATFASAMARPGNVGFVSQSGALGTAILDWSLRENVGFSAFVSVGSMMDVAHERLRRLCFIDYDREIALIAERKDPSTGEWEIMGVGRLSKLPGAQEAECAVLVGDRFQRLGLGMELMRRLIQVGRDEKLQCIVADILYENYAMQRICKKLGFSVRRVLEEGVVKATLEL